MMNSVDCLRLGAIPSGRVWGVSGSVHPHGENCRQSQALSAPPHEKWGTSQALCTPMMKSPRVSGAECTAHENCGASQGVCTPSDENCRQSQALCTPVHENCGTSQALCTPIITVPTVSGSGNCVLRSPKLEDVSGSLHPHGENCRQSPALRTPLHENLGCLRLCTSP